MYRKGLLTVLLLLSLISAGIAGQVWLKPTERPAPENAIESHVGPGAYLAPGPPHAAKFEQDAPAEHLGIGEEWWLWVDLEDIWLGNLYFQHVAAALEFINDSYPLVRVKAIRYNFWYESPPLHPLGGHVWDDDGTGRPTWLDDTTSIKNFDLYDFPIRVDWRYDLDPPYPEFSLGEHFWVGWQVKHWYWGNYSGWNWTGVPPYYSWWWNTGYWYKICEQPGHPYYGDHTMEVLVDYEPFEPDLDIHDDYCNLEGNRMRLTGIPGSAVAGYYLLVNPDEDGTMPNVDLWDGPGDCDFDSITYQNDDLRSRITPDTIIPADSVDPNLVPVNGLNNGEAACNWLQVLIPPGLPKDIYVGQVRATAWYQDSSDTDWFDLEVEVVGSGGSFGSPGLWATAEAGANLINWSRFGIDELGYNLYRSHANSAFFGRLNSQLLQGTNFSDADIVAGATYRYKLGVLQVDGKELFIGPISVTSRLRAPTTFALSQNYPNPFTHSTRITYSVPPRHGKEERGGDLSTYQLINLSIYDRTGRLVRTLVDEPKEPGYYSMSWDGKDGSGTAVSAGVYFYRLKAGHFHSTRKLLVVR